MVVWFAHVRVGHRQHLILNPSLQKQRGGFVWGVESVLKDSKKNTTLDFFMVLALVYNPMTKVYFFKRNLDSYKLMDSSCFSVY